MAKKKADPKAKAKRQKVFVAVGGVLLLGVLAIQVPRTMKMLKPQDQTASSSTSSVATSTTAGSTPLAPPTLDGAAAAAPGSGAPTSAASSATSADGVSDPSNPLPPNAGQLVSFSKFKSKDPFHQQVDVNCAAAGGCASGSTKPSSSKTPATAPGSTSSVGSTPSALITHASKPVPMKATTATISVNGVGSTVAVGSAFPAGVPVFTLVSLTSGGAKIGIAGGSYEDGAATATLKKGRTVTLMNTADGRRYVLRLVAAS
jgi:hypothetical protein